jgi:hypothetical protein
MPVIIKSNIIEEMNKQVKKIRTRTRAGVISALLVVKRDALKMTPVDTGNLRGSNYTDVFLTVKGVVGEIGYTASYAPYVHEVDKHYRKSGTSWKFLEKALIQNKEKIIQIIKQEALIK